MLIHPDFPVRMVQRGGKRNSSAPIVEQTAWQPQTAQVNPLWPPFLTHSSPQERDLCLGRIKFLYTWSKSFRGKPNWVRQLKRTEHKRPLLEQALLPPSFLVSYARKSNFLSAGGHQQHDLVRYWDFFPPVFVLILLIFKAATKPETGPEDPPSEERSVTQKPAKET